MYKAKKILKIIRKIGLRVLLYRLWIAIQSKSGILKLRFPNKKRDNYQHCILEDFRNLNSFFLVSRSKLCLERRKDPSLAQRFEDIKKGNYIFFHGKKYNLGLDYNWVTNPETGYTYNVNKHFSEISDFSETAGDIKYVWEPSRFCWLYDIIRYDHHFDEDNSEFVFQQILDWIGKNPINLGPNFKCSQEISIRILNWTFALFFYRDSTTLDQKILNEILNSIASQIAHVVKHINFSRIAVRNNHAITETFAIYAIHTYFPFLPNAKSRAKAGARMFKKEILFQIYDDGSYLQHSMNYHRLVVQILTWAFRTSELTKDNSFISLKSKAQKTLNFLSSFTNHENGYLPNYGANDGSLIFPLNSSEYRDYRGQINALSYVLNKETLYTVKATTEDIFWLYSNPKITYKKLQTNCLPEIIKFDYSGYYIFKDDDFFLFIRCGNIIGRTGLNDNLHIDLWFKNKNIFRDSGTFGYNTSKDLKSFFMGTKSHNTVMVQNYDQIEKGPRFLSFGKSKVKGISVKLKDDEFSFVGEISAFEEISASIYHRREIKYKIGSNKFIIKDTVNTTLLKRQIWNYDNQYGETFEIFCCSSDKQVTPIIEQGYFSNSYGDLIKQDQMIYQSNNNTITTEILFRKKN